MQPILVRPGRRPARVHHDGQSVRPGQVGERLVDRFDGLPVQFEAYHRRDLRAQIFSQPDEIDLAFAGFQRALHYFQRGPGSAPHEVHRRFVFHDQVAERIFHAHDPPVGVDDVGHAGIAQVEGVFAAVGAGNRRRGLIVEIVRRGHGIVVKILVRRVFEREIAEVPVPAGLVRDGDHGLCRGDR